MTVETSTIRTGSTARPDSEQGLLEANRVALTIKDRWQAGDTPDLAGALATHPNLKRYKSVVLDLACQEFKCRLEAGEKLDAEAFSQRFPSLQRSLYLLIGAENLLSNDPNFQALQGLLPWPEPGDRFLQFELIAEIGRGTFGRVFLATEPALGNRRIVVKVQPQGGQEAEILGRLRHPNIVPVYSMREDDSTGLAALCMPYVGRATLCDVLDHVFAQSDPPSRARAILDTAEIVNEGCTGDEPCGTDLILRTACYVDGIVHLGVQLADALAYSHSRGVYHRDLKPSNVLMTSEGRPLLLDFNLSLDGRLLTGKVGGTVPYMAPEELVTLFEKPQNNCLRHYDPRSDIFSLGVILYELLTGNLPFGEMPWGRPLEELARHLHASQRNSPIPIRDHNARVDSRLARLIESCLAFEPERRPETATQFADALRKESSFIRRTTRWMGNHRKSVAGAAVVVFAAVLAVSFFFALRPPYSIRQFRLGLAYNQQGQYAQAVDCLTKSIHTDPSSSDALFVRGIAHQRMEEFEAAIQDYSSVHRLTPRPFQKACEGYCLSRINSHRAAIAAYKIALDEGYDSPAVLYNNIGFDYLQLRQVDDAEKCFQQAIQLDDGLQAAHYNLVMIALRRTIRPEEPVPENMLIHAARAIEIGPATAELYHFVAALYATAAKQDAGLTRPAIEYVRKAVELGCNPEKFTSDIRFFELQKEPTFSDAVEEPAITAISLNPPKVIQLIDPLDRR